MNYLLSKVRRTPMGGALWDVSNPAGQCSWSLYWNGPGSRLQLGFRPTDPDGLLTSISALGYDSPIMDFEEAEVLAHRFVDARAPSDIR